jgi:CRP-like cAMP-binding protein
MERGFSGFEMHHGDVLYEADEPITNVYFPVTGAASIIAQDPDGRSVDVAVVGNEGFVGLPVFLGTDQIPTKALTQVPGGAIRMSASAFREEIAHGGKLVDLMMRYAQMRMVEMSQTILCNRFHGIVERTARWLLQLNERVEEAPFELTQQFFATMLGANRPNVTEAARALKERGLIDYSRGTIDVLDAEGLEAASCDCYRIVRDELDRLLETGPSGSS